VARFVPESTMPIEAYLFTGIAGVKKRQCLNYLRKHILRDVPADRVNFIIPLVELARLNRPEVEGDLFDLYRTYDDRLQKFQHELEKYNSPDYNDIRCVFIHTHLTNFITGHFRSWVGSSDYDSLFKGVKIARIINLIDNVYSCQFEVAKDGYPYTLDQLITWRDNEQMATEILAGLIFRGQSEFVTYKVVAVNHCLSTVESLLFDPSKPEIYMAYPISKLRALQDLIQTFGDVSLEVVIGGSDKLKKETETEKDVEKLNNVLKLVAYLKKEFRKIN
jgi:hypothetical protein